jgi:Catalase
MSSSTGKRSRVCTRIGRAVQCVYNRHVICTLAPFFKLPDVSCCFPSGEHNLLDDEAVTVGGSNHSHATADLQEAIAAGDYPEWTLCIQTMEIADEDK